MEERQFMLNYWRTSLVDARYRLEREPFAIVRAEIRKRIANYEAWIAKAEARLTNRGYKL